MHKLGVVEGALNLLEASWTISLQRLEFVESSLYEFGVVRLYRTFSNYRGSRCSCARYGVVEVHQTLLKPLEPHQWRERNLWRVVYMSLEWFDCNEPSLTTSVEEMQGVRGAHAPFRGGWSASRTTSLQRVQLVESSLHEFRVVRLYQTFSNYICKGKADAHAPVRCGWSALNLLEASRTTSLQRQQGVERVVYISSEWFDCTEPSLTSYVDVK